MSPSFSEGSLYLSDLHVGRKPERSDLKLRAFLMMIEEAHHRGIRKIVGLGDMADGRSSRKDEAAEGKVVARVLEPWQASGRLVEWFRGNHDDEEQFTDAELLDLFGVTPSKELIDFDERNKIFRTHGHVFGVRKVEHLVKAAKEQQAAKEGAGIRLHLPDEIRNGLRTLTLIYDTSHQLEQCLVQYGIPANEIWESLERGTMKTRAKLADLLRRITDKKKGKKHAWDKAADMIDLQCTLLAGTLSDAQGGWGAVVGHTHVPGLHKRIIKNPQTGMDTVQAVANCGSFVSAYEPTCVYVRDRHMQLMQYNSKKNKLKELDAIEITAEEEASNVAARQAYEAYLVQAS